MPTSVALYQALPTLSWSTGHRDQAVESLERGLKSAAEKTELRLMLANLLAEHGNTGKLLLQIEELKKIGFQPVILQFLTAQYHINSKNFGKLASFLFRLSRWSHCPRLQGQG